MTKTIAVVALALAAFGVGCHSGGGAADASATAAAGGPVPADAQVQTWQSDSGPIAMLDSPSTHLRISATCKTPAGTLSCEAYAFVNNPVHVDISPAERSRGTSQGTLRCVKTGHTLVSVHDAAGNQDSFCKMSDGSMVATGSIEAKPMP